MRKSPTPCAPNSRARRASPGRSRFARSVRAASSSVTAAAGTPSGTRRVQPLILVRRCSNRCASTSPGSITTCPERPSTMIVWPSRVRSKTSPSPTTAGISMDLARMAQCAAREPVSVASPLARSGSRRATKLGVRSRATITASTASSRSHGLGSPRRRPSTRSFTSCRSFNRSRTIVWDVESK